MKIFDEVVEKRKILTAYQCDRCGKVFDVSEDVFEVQEFLHIDFNAGYASIFGDMNLVQADICQHCLKDILGDVLRIKQGWNIDGQF